MEDRVMNTTTPEYLLSAQGCERDICYGGHEDAVKMRQFDERWFITMGHPGFNTPANNRNGYVSRAAAESTIRRYGRHA
jgi:hypothetical protein